MKIKKTIQEVFPLKIYINNSDKSLNDHMIILHDAMSRMEKINLKYNASDRVLKNSREQYISHQKCHWGDSEYFGKEFLNPIYKEIFNFINKASNEYVSELNIDKSKFKVKMTSSYLNKCDVEAGPQKPHNHLGSLLSFTYYFHLEGDVQPIKILSPICQSFFAPLAHITSPEFITYIPQVGDVIIFPSFLTHEVPSNETGIRWLFNGDFHVYSDHAPNFPPVPTEI